MGPKKKGLQELGDEFYTLIGQCVVAWSNVDDELFRIFQHCVGPVEQSAIVYYRTPGLDVRFGLTDEIVRSVLPKRPRRSGGHDHKDVKAWRQAKGDYKELLGTRRRIAHHPVRMHHSSILDVPDITAMADVLAPSWFEIYVSEHEALREQSSNRRGLKVGDLRNHLVAVLRLSDRLRHFYADVLSQAA
jgi:hypothetical protein